MVAVSTDLLIEQGTTWAQAWRITNFDLDTTTWHVEAQVRRRVSDETVLHDFTPTATIIDDVVTLSATPDESTAWGWEQGVYDVEIHGADGRVFRIAEGRVSVSPEVTR